MEIAFVQIEFMDTHQQIPCGKEGVLVSVFNIHIAQYQVPEAQTENIRQVKTEVYAANLHAGLEFFGKIWASYFAGNPALYRPGLKQWKCQCQ